MFFDFPNAFARSSLMTEKFDVASIALGIVCAYQTEKCRFSCTVFAAKSPFFTFTDSPIQILENSSVAVFDIDLIEFQNAAIFVSQVGYICFFRILKQMFYAVGFRFRQVGSRQSCQIGLARLFITDCQVVNRDYMRNKVRNIIGFGQDQNDLQTGFSRQGTQ